MAERKTRESKLCRTQSHTNSQLKGSSTKSLKKHKQLILLLLSRFSHVRLYATPWTAAHQAPPSLGFSRQEHWSGLLLQCMKVKSESEVALSCSTLWDPMDCSLPGSSVPGIFQARVPEWGPLPSPKATNTALH